MVTTAICCKRTEAALHVDELYVKESRRGKRQRLCRISPPLSGMAGEAERYSAARLHNAS
jgi:hypothetical protein